MRILHLITDTPRPSEMHLAWAMDSLSAVPGSRAVTLGTADLPRRVAALAEAGTPITHFAAGRGIGRGFAAMLRLRRTLRSDPCRQQWGAAAGRGSGADVIHAWSLHAAAVAAWACPGVPILLTSEPPSAAGATVPAWMRAVLRTLRSLTWLAPETPDAAELRRLGLAKATVLPVTPPVNLARLADPAERVRKRVGWGVTRPQTRLVALLSDRSERIEAMSAAMGVGLAWETGRDLRLLISPRAGQLPRAMRVIADARRTDRVIVDEAADRPWEIAHAADAAIVLGDGLSLAWATAAGLPTLAPLSGVGRADGCHEPLFDEIFARPESDRPGRIAPHICQLHDAYADAHRTATRLRERARQIHGLQTFRRRVLGVYEAVAGGEAPRWQDVTPERAAG